MSAPVSHRSGNCHGGQEEMGPSFCRRCPLIKLDQISKSALIETVSEEKSGGPQWYIVRRLGGQMYDYLVKRVSGDLVSDLLSGNSHTWRRVSRELKNAVPAVDLCVMCAVRLEKKCCCGLLML